ncbi:hypothetical protein KY285_030459 [Solanum tuberosum]|nr:hypothetical protein KY285_030459 [Solanum tuberosum]
MSHVNKKNAEYWSCHKKGHFEQDCPMSNSKEKASVSIVGQWSLSQQMGLRLWLYFAYEILKRLFQQKSVMFLKKNLISMGTLEKQGYKYMSEEGTMKVTKGYLVMLKAKMEDGLYTLAGSTIIGSLSNDDKGKLWHMRLGDMSARGVEMLSNRNLLNGEKISTLEFYEHCVLGKQKNVSFNTGKHKTKGLEPRAKKAIFIGYIDGVKGYKLWCFSLLKFIVSRDVTFDESSTLDPHKVSVELSRNENNEKVELPVELTKEKDQETQVDESKDAYL